MCYAMQIVEVGFFISSTEYGAMVYHSYVGSSSK